MEKIMHIKYRKKRTPYFYIMLSFFLVILCGTLLLCLPFSASGKPLTFLQALFTTTSSVCVTGLSVIQDLSTTLSVFGKIIVAILMEIGGLSFLTIMFFIFSIIGNRTNLSTSFLLKEALNTPDFRSIFPLIKNIIFIALSIQAIAIIPLMFVFVPFFNNDFWRALGVSIFHAISSFCNAGFDIIGDSSCIALHDNILFNIVTMFLIICGGLGFIVIVDVLSKKRFKMYRLHTKIVLFMTAILLVIPPIIFKILNTDLSFLECMFLSTTARTAGFTTIDLTRLNKASIVLLDILMFIGASPCSTGGGLKTTTLFLIALNMVSFMKGRSTKTLKRNVSSKSIMNAYVLLSFSILFLVTTIFVLTIADRSNSFTIKEISFESISAFATVGLSLGITTKLNPFSQIVLCITMFVGRVGPLTITSLWNHNYVNRKKEDIEYVNEDVIVG